MKIKRFNESKEELLEEVKDIFSYVIDEYNLSVKYETDFYGVNYVEIRGKIINYMNTAHDTIASYTFDKKKTVSMLDDISDCLKRMSIDSQVYHTFKEYHYEFVLEISRDKFDNSKLFKYE